MLRGGCQAFRVPGRIIGPLGADPGGGGAGGAPPGRVVLVGDGGAVDGFLHDPAGGVAAQRHHRCRGHRLHEPPGPVVAEPGGPLDGASFDQVTDIVVNEGGFLAQCVDHADELPGPVVPVGVDAAVEVRLGGEPPGRVVFVPPPQPGRVLHHAQPQFGVVPEPVFAAVRADPPDRQIEDAGSDIGAGAGGVGVRDKVAFPVPVPPLLRAVGGGAMGEFPGAGPTEGGGSADRVDGADQPSEPVVAQLGAATARIGHRGGLTGPVGDDGGDRTQRVRHRRHRTRCLPGADRDSAGRVGHRQNVPGSVVADHRHRAGRVDDLHRQPEAVAVERLPTPVGVGHLDQPARLVVFVRSAAAKRVGAHQQPVIAVPQRGGDRAERVGVADDLPSLVERELADRPHRIGDQRPTRQIGEPVRQHPTPPRGPHTPPNLVVRVRVGNVIPVRPPHNAAPLITPEPQRSSTSGVGDGCQISGVVVTERRHHHSTLTTDTLAATATTATIVVAVDDVAVAHDQRGDPSGGGAHLYPVATGMRDRLDDAVGVVTEINPIVIAVGNGFDDTPTGGIGRCKPAGHPRIGVRQLPTTVG